MSRLKNVSTHNLKQLELITYMGAIAILGGATCRIIDAIWPSDRLFMFWWGMTGLVLACFYAYCNHYFYKELKRRRKPWQRV
jgi:hypothetical protein